MKKIDLSNILAAEMDRAFEDNKPLFASSSMLEKLAFKKVSEEDSTTEVEAALESSLLKKQANAKCCDCETKDKRKENCSCVCHKEVAVTASSIVSNSLNSLIKISEDLDRVGFSKLAAASIMLADALIATAKEKSSPAKSSKEEKSKSSKEDSKSKSSNKSKPKKKMDMKERMKKMREGKKSKKSSK